MNDSSVRSHPRTIPAEIDSWNWGAFLFHFIWGLRNKAYITFLAIVPALLGGFFDHAYRARGGVVTLALDYLCFFIILIMLFVFGWKGNAWAWRNKRWDSVEHFKRVQRRWAKWGAIIWIFALVASGSMVGGTLYTLKHSEAYEIGVANLKTNLIAVSILGSPISTRIPFGAIVIKDNETVGHPIFSLQFGGPDLPSGPIFFNGVSGKAALSFSATGPKTAGVVLAEALEENGVWSITRLVLKLNDSGKEIDLLNGPSFPALTGRVVDIANLLTPEEQARLEAKLKAHEEQTSDQVVVATVPSLGELSIENYANTLFNSWGLGQKDKNNGVLLLVAPKERKVRIEVGYGLERTLTGAISSNILDTAISPKFKLGDFAGGVEAGIDQILAALSVAASKH
jgi:hypothetical protein